jgi:hypothetical protein
MPRLWRRLHTGTLTCRGNGLDLTTSASPFCEIGLGGQAFIDLAISLNFARPKSLLKFSASEKPSGNPQNALLEHLQPTAVGRGS